MIHEGLAATERRPPGERHVKNPGSFARHLSGEHRVNSTVIRDSAPQSGCHAENSIQKRSFLQAAATRQRSLDAFLRAVFDKQAPPLPLPPSEAMGSRGEGHG